MSKTIKIIIFAVVVLAALFAVYWFFFRTPGTSKTPRTSCRYDVETYVPPPGGVGEGSCVNKITGAESNPV